MENSFQGRLFLASDPKFTTQPALVAGELTILESAASTGGVEFGVSGKMTVTPKPKEKTMNGMMAETVNSEEVTVDAELTVDSKIYETFLATYQGKECEIRIVDTQTGRMASVQFIPNIVPVMTIGKAIIANMTGTYTDPANVSSINKRFKIVKLTSV